MTTAARPNTPDRITYDEHGHKSTRITTKRACNGCSLLIGDITDAEMNAAIAGAPLPDVRSECPTCAPTAPPPACKPMNLVVGDQYCLELECDHHLGAGEYCDEVREEQACAVHSRYELPNERGEITHAEPWPCQYDAARPVSA